MMPKMDPITAALVASDPNRMYYLQDKRTYVGNCVMWWRSGGAGYTTDLTEAGIFTRKEAFEKMRQRATDIPWPKDYIDTIARPRVDMQVMKKKDILE